MQGLTTIIGNTTIPNTNGTATTLLANASGTNATGAHSDALAQNVTSANAFTKENVTAPVSPTGISTEAERAIPPLMNSTNNSNFSSSIGASSSSLPGTQ